MDKSAGEKQKKIYINVYIKVHCSYSFLSLFYYIFSMSYIIQGNKIKKPNWETARLRKQDTGKKGRLVGLSYFIHHRGNTVPVYIHVLQCIDYMYL